MKSANTIKEPAARRARDLGANAITLTGSTISIADLLDVIKENLPDGLSKNVLANIFADDFVLFFQYSLCNCKCLDMRNAHMYVASAERMHTCNGSVPKLYIWFSGFIVQYFNIPPANPVESGC